MSLNLEPNEVIGYRIKPDWHSFNVVLLKKHGPSSKNAGQEYATPLAYCKSIPFAADWILSHASRMYGEESQAKTAAISGSLVHAEDLKAAFARAAEETLKAVAELQSRVDALGLSRKELVQALNDTPPSEA